MKDYCQETGITIVFAPAAAHKSVGMIERANETLQQAFKKTMSPIPEWDEAPSLCLPGVNSRLIDHLRYSPAEIVFGSEDLPARIRHKSTHPTGQRAPQTRKTNSKQSGEFMVQRANVREDAYNQIVKSKDKIKQRCECL